MQTFHCINLFMVNNMTPKNANFSNLNLLSLYLFPFQIQI